MPEAPKPPMAETAQLLQNLGSVKKAAELRAWAASASEEDLMTLVRGLREVHASWLHADASLINMNVELSIEKQAHAQAKEAAEAERMQAESSNQQLVARLAESERRLAQSDAQLAEMNASLEAKNAEVHSLTMALQRAILEQKGVAEIMHKGRAK